MKAYLFKLTVGLEGQQSTDYVISLADKLGKVEEEYLSKSHHTIQIHKIEIVSTCQILSSAKIAIEEEFKQANEFKHLTDKGAVIEIEPTSDCWICSACGWVSKSSPCESCKSIKGIPYSREDI